MTKKTPPIKYISRDFESIKQDLINYAKVYYPDTFKDFNKASFGAMLLDMVAYVGDIMSFYADYQLNETFIDTAIETKNILKLAKQMGYKHPGAPSATGEVTFYIVIPAANDGTPDESLIPVLKRDTLLSSQGGSFFVLNEDVDFSKPDVEVVVAETDANGRPDSYAYRANGSIISGQFETEFIEMPAYDKFLKLRLGGENITEIISVLDSEGHEYFEVDYLSQNVVYHSVRNITGSDKESVPYILREMIVPRRFTVEHTVAGETFLQFGYGSNEQLRGDLFPEPSDAVLQMHGKKYFKESSFDPSMLLKTDKFGIVPPVGTLTVTYRKNTSSNVNAPADSITSVADPVLDFTDSSTPAATRATIRDSLQVTNEEPIVGDVRAITPDEIRLRALDAYASQNRAVTKQDYLSIIYKMPAKFGSIKRANIVQDKNSFKRNLNLYVMSEGVDGKLSLASSTLKENLKLWINKYKMINDTVDILDGKIANIGIEFEVIGSLDKSKSEVLLSSVEALKEEYGRAFNFGTPFYVSDVYRILNDLPEVIDVTSVKIVNKTGQGYISSAHDIENNLSPDGRFIHIPEHTVLEIKYPDADIVGVVL